MQVLETLGLQRRGGAHELDDWLCVVWGFAGTACGGVVNKVYGRVGRGLWIVHVLVERPVHERVAQVASAFGLEGHCQLQGSSGNAPFTSSGMRIGRARARVIWPQSVVARQSSSLPRKIRVSRSLLAAFMLATRVSTV